MKRHLTAIVLLLCLLALVVLAGPAATVARAASYVVSNLDDSGPGSLRQAILDANATPGADTITFSVSGTITLASTLPAISDADGLTIDGVGRNITVSGNDAIRVMFVDVGAALTVKDVTISNGFNTGFGGGGIFNGGTLTVADSTFSENNSAVGAAIYNAGTLAITGSLFSNNIALNDGGSIVNTLGRTITVSESIFSGNSARAGAGGGIFNFGGTLTVTDSTFSGNSADFGGGIENRFTGTATVSNSTFSGNRAQFLGGGIANLGVVTIGNSTFSGNSAEDDGGGIFNNGILTLKNTIVAGSLPGGNCSGSGTITDSGGNLSFPDVTCPGINVDPQLGPLQVNTPGNTATHALVAGSPAVDAAVDCPPPAADQRGVTRPQGDACDIGAFELAPPYASAGGPYTVNEGGSVTFDASGTTGAEQDPTTLDYAWDFDGDGQYDDATGISPTFSAANIDGPTTVTVGLQVADDGGLVDTDTAPVTVNNVAPMISAVANDGPIIASESATITVDASDPAGAADPLSYAFDCSGDGSYEVGPQAGNSTSCLFTLDGSFTVNVQVADDDGGVTSGSTTVTVITPQQAIANLQADVQALVEGNILNKGQGNALNSKLANAIKKLDQGQPHVVINNLNAFINQVNAFISSGILTAAEGQPLIDAADRVITAIEAE